MIAYRTSLLDPLRWQVTKRTKQVHSMIICDVYIKKQSVIGVVLISPRFFGPFLTFLPRTRPGSVLVYAVVFQETKISNNSAGYCAISVEDIHSAIVIVVVLPAVSSTTEPRRPPKLLLFRLWRYKRTVEPYRMKGSMVHICSLFLSVYFMELLDTPDTDASLRQTHRKAQKQQSRLQAL